MYRKLFLATLLISAPCRSASIEKTESDVNFFGIKEREKDRLYVGKVTDDFHLAMERVATDEDAKMWKAYAARQYDRIREYSARPLKYLPITGGCAHFEKVIDSAKLLKDDNELWVAYASNKEVVKGKRYISDENIEMYVSVLIPISTPVTAHMGISRTWQAALDFEKQFRGKKSSGRRKHPDQSVYLHSFAAKVSKVRYPEKVFMFTAPVPAMRDILIHKMPIGSVFVGDSEYQKEIERQAQDIILMKKEAEEEQEYSSETIVARRDRLKTHPPRIQETITEADWKLTFFNADESPLVTLDKSKSTDYWAFTCAYRSPGLLSPYVLVDLKTLAQVKLLKD